MESNSILPSVQHKDEAKATLWSWQQTFDRLKRRGVGQINEIAIPDSLLNLGLDVTYRFGLMVRESNVPSRHRDDHPLLAEIIDGSHSDEYITARVNSLFDNRELVSRDRKTIELGTLVRILDGLEETPNSGVITDHTDKSIYVASRARVKLTFALLDSAGARADFIKEVDGALVLDPSVTELVVANPDRVDALIELIRERYMRNIDEIKEMLEDSDANRFMEGAL